MSNIEQDLSSSEVAVKVEALSCLKAMEEEAIRLLPAVAKLLGDGNWSVRREAAEVLSNIADNAAEQVPDLGKLLTDAHPGVVSAAAQALAAVGEKAASQAEALEKVLDNHSEDKTTLVMAVSGAAPKARATLRKPVCAAAVALAALGESGLKSAPKIAELLKSSDPEIRIHASMALGSMGKNGAKYESEVLALINDKSPQVVVVALSTLGDMALSSGASESVAGIVAECLKSAQPMVRSAAAKALGEMGDEAQAYLPQIAKCLKDPSPAVVMSAMTALGRCGEQGEMYAGVVCRMIYDPRQDIRVAATFAMSGFQTRGIHFKDELARLLEDECEHVAAAALQVLQTMETQTPSALENQHGATLPVALLFPGQGSQYMKMMSEVCDQEAVKDLLKKADAILGYDLLKLCQTGPEEELERTINCQPVMYVADLAAVESLRRDRPALIDQVRAVGGLSLGEYAALTFAGVWDFETGLRLVKARAEAMAEATAASDQAMASVAGLDREDLDALCREAASGEGEVCQVSNCLFPKGFSCSGTKIAIEKLADLATAKGALQAKMLKTGGAFHTSLMEPARAKLIKALKDAEPQMHPTRIAVYMNLTGQMVPTGTSPSELIPMLADQICNPVLWDASMQAMIQDGITEFYECGPMKQLRAMMKRIDTSAWNNMTNVLV